MPLASTRQVDAAPNGVFLDPTLPIAVWLGCGGALRNRLGMRQAEVRTGRSTSLRGPRFTLFGLIGEWADCCEA